MNKSEFISAIGNRTLKKDAEIKPIIDAAITIIAEKLSAGESIAIPGFGTFEAKARKARIGRNPHTKEPIEIPATRVPTFNPSKGLKDSVGQ